LQKVKTRAPERNANEPGAPDIATERKILRSGYRVPNDKISQLRRSIEMTRILVAMCVQVHWLESPFPQRAQQDDIIKNDIRDVAPKGVTTTKEARSYTRQQDRLWSRAGAVAHVGIGVERLDAAQV
jgi:hypothetical protein